jgi:hypothetical protein
LLVGCCLLFLVKNNKSCAEASLPISNTPNIVLDHGGVMCNFTLGGSSGSGN